MPKKIVMSLIILIFSLNLAEAQTVFGKYAGEFMAIGVGGRALGMGGAFVSVANDVTAGYYNPAGLGHIDYPQIALMHDERYGNLVNYDYAAVGIPFSTDMSFGLSIMRLGVDDIPDTRGALIDLNGNGILDGNEKLDYNLISKFSNQDWAFYLTFAKRESETFYYGANVKFIKRSLGDFSATGVGFDIGAWYVPFERLSVGANIQDVTTTLVSWSTGRNELIAPTAKIGASYRLDFLGGVFTPALDLDVRFENRRFASNFNIGPVSFDMHAGLEYNYKNIFAIRGGYNDVKQFTIGAGVKLPKLNIDYSFAKFNMSELDRLPDTHRISLILTLEQDKFKRTGM